MGQSIKIVSTRINDAWMRRDLQDLVSRGLGVQDAIKALQLSKYLVVETQPAQATPGAAGAGAAAEQKP